MLAVVGLSAFPLYTPLFLRRLRLTPNRSSCAARSLDRTDSAAAFAPWFFSRSFSLTHSHLHHQICPMGPMMYGLHRVWSPVQHHPHLTTNPLFPQVGHV